MNPQVVCSVAGLCNNEKIHKMLAESSEVPKKDAVSTKPDKCQGCHTVVTILEDRFNKISKDDVLHKFLQVNIALFKPCLDMYCCSKLYAPPVPGRNILFQGRIYMSYRYLILFTFDVYTSHSVNRLVIKKGCVT